MASGPSSAESIAALAMWQSNTRAKSLSDSKIRKMASDVKCDTMAWQNPK